MRRKLNCIQRGMSFKTADGTGIERRMFERRINNAGFPEYEAVKFPSGTGCEFFFIKDTLI